MKLKSAALLATLVVALGLLLGTSVAQAATVNFDPNDSIRAIGIADLYIGGTIYDVDFVGPTEAVNVYGDLPGDFEFTSIISAAAAVNAAGGVKYVDPEGGANNPFAEVYDVGWSTDTFVGVPFANNVESFVTSRETRAKRSSPDLYHESPIIFPGHSRDSCLTKSFLQPRYLAISAIFRGVRHLFADNDYSYFCIVYKIFTVGYVLL